MPLCLGVVWSRGQAFLGCMVTAVSLGGALLGRLTFRRSSYENPGRDCLGCGRAKSPFERFACRRIYHVKCRCFVADFVYHCKIRVLVLQVFSPREYQVMRRIITTLTVVAVLPLLGVSYGGEQQQGGVPADIVEQLEYLVGTWKVTGHLSDEEFTGTVSYRWAGGRGKRKCCLATNWRIKRGDEANPGISLIGWNTAKKRLVECGFNAAGGCSMMIYTIKSPTEWRGEFSEVHAGQEIKGKGVLVKKGPTEFVYEGETTTGETGRLVFQKVTEEGERRKARRQSR